MPPNQEVPPRSGPGILTFSLIIVVCLIYDAILSNNFVDLQTVQNDLKDNVHHQTEAVDVVIQTLKQTYNRDQNLNVVCLIGPSGVGKTHVSNIVKRHFNSPVYDLHGPFDDRNRQISVINSLQNDITNLNNMIIIDDLTLNDTDNLLSFIKELPQDSVILVMCVFSIQETDFNLTYSINYDNIDRIREKFVKAEIPHNLALFHEFTPSQMQNWVQKQLIAQGLDPESRPDIVNDALIQQNVKFHGLKGLHSKIRVKL